MRLPGLAAATLAGILCAGCASEPKTAQAFGRDWASWKSEPKERPAPVGAEVREVVRDAKRWADFWVEGAPEVDFGRDLVLVATQKYCEHPKDRVRIWRVRYDEGEKERYVYVKVGQVGGDFKNEPKYGPEFHFVVVPAFEGGVHWRDIKVVYDVEGEPDSFELVKNWDE